MSFKAFLLFAASLSEIDQRQQRGILQLGEGGKKVGLTMNKDKKTT